ncbi:hypothetical protein ONZ45_g4433 [Pleurotus djamor]|nr:hypothetical protein ONZ45_g4433 [Pleurotus djamor]
MQTQDISVPEDIIESLQTNYVGFASFTILVWDHMITFSDEVRYVWKGKKGPIIYLFFLNRYFTPLSFIVNLYAYLSPTWTPEVRLHRILFEFSVPHNPLSGVHSCSIIYDPHHNAAAATSAWFPLMFDSIVFGLTFYRTWPSIRRQEAGYIAQRLFEDGLLYYT